MGIMCLAEAERYEADKVQRAHHKIVHCLNPGSVAFAYYWQDAVREWAIIKQKTWKTWAIIKQKTSKGWKSGIIVSSNCFLPGIVG
eukprot:2768334-Ditylum_brightwellii.AAC.1